MTNAFRRDSAPGAPARGLRFPCTGAGTLHTSGGSEELPCHQRRTQCHRTRAASSVALMAQHLGLGCCWGLISPWGLEESVPCPELTNPGGARQTPAARHPSQVCGAQVTAPGRRENCKIVAAKSTPLKMAIIHTSNVGNDPLGQLMRKTPLCLATSYPSHSWLFESSPGVTGEPRSGEPRERGCAS